MRQESLLNLNTKRLSSLFHVKHDDFFETVRPSSGYVTVLNLRYLAGLIKGFKSYAKEYNEPSLNNDLPVTEDKGVDIEANDIPLSTNDEDNNEPEQATTLKQLSIIAQ